MKIDADESKELDGMVAVDPDTGAWERIHRLKGQASVAPNGSWAIVGKQLIDLWYAVPPRTFAPPEDGGDLIWSGDGSRLIVVYSKRGPGKNQRVKSTFWMDSDGSNPMRLGIPDTDSVVDWSRDCTAVVTVADRNRTGSGYQLYVMRPDGVGAAAHQRRERTERVCPLLSGRTAGRLLPSRQRCHRRQASDRNREC